MKDMTGDRVGLLTVLNDSGARRNGSEVIWLCSCECGEIVKRPGHKLRKSKNASCGCRGSFGLIGKRFGRMIVTGVIPQEPFLKCLCDCGTFVTMRMHRIKSGHVKSCGCLKEDVGRSTKIDIVGNRYGRLTVVSEVKNRGKGGHILWNCACDCGNLKTIPGGALRGGRTRSCGCFKKFKSRQTGLKSNNLKLSANHKKFITKSLAGKKIGRLRVVRHIANRGWLCLCECGNEVMTGRSALEGGRQLSCGCYQREYYDSLRTLPAGAYALTRAKRESKYLTDSYVVSQIKKQCDVSRREVGVKMIEIKRENIKSKRILRELERGLEK